MPLPLSLSLSLSPPSTPLSFHTHTLYLLLLSLSLLYCSLSFTHTRLHKPLPCYQLEHYTHTHTHTHTHSHKTPPTNTLLSARALIQFPSANRLLLMFAPSLSLAPLLVVTVALSEPARSISDILALVTCALRPAVLAFWWTNT